MSVKFIPDIPPDMAASDPDFVATLNDRFRRIFLTDGSQGNGNGGQGAPGAPGAAAVNWDTEAYVDAYGAIGDGASHPLSTRYATLVAAQAVYPRASALTDEIDWCAIQKAIDSGKAVVNFSNKKYYINRCIDLTMRNTGNMHRPITLRGKGQSQLGGVGTTTIIGNTGNWIIDMCASSFVTIRSMLLWAAPVTFPTFALCPNPAYGGVLMGRGNDPTGLDGGTKYCEFNNLEDVYVAMDSRPTATAVGTIGVFNCAAETFTMIRVLMLADLPFPIAAYNPFAPPFTTAPPVSSPYIGAISVAINSMIDGTLKMCMMRAWTRAGCEMWDVHHIHFDECYWSRQGGSTTQAAINLQTESSHCTFTGVQEEFETVMHLNKTARYFKVDMRCAQGGSLHGSPYVQMEGGLFITDSEFSIEQGQPPCSLPLFNDPPGSRLYACTINLGENQSIQSPVNLLAYGCIINAMTGVPATDIVFALGSTYIAVSSLDTRVVGSFRAMNGLNVDAGGATIVGAGLISGAGAQLQVNGKVVSAGGYGAVGVSTGDLVLGGGGPDATHAGSFCWGNGTGYVFLMGTAIAGIFTQKFSFRDDGYFTANHAVGALGGYGQVGVSTGDLIMGGGGPDAAHAVSLCWGDGTGYNLLLGAKVAGVFAPRFGFTDTGAFIAIGVTAPAVSDAATGRIYFDTAAGKFKVSEATGAYVNLLSSAGVTSAIGTANQVIVSASTGAVTFSLPQDIHTGASPSFVALTTSGDVTCHNIRASGGDAIIAETATLGIAYLGSDLNGFIERTAGTFNLGACTGLQLAGVQIISGRGAAVADATIATTQISGAAYTSNEQNMLTNLKADVTTLKTQLNLWLARARNHGLIS